MVIDELVLELEAMLQEQRPYGFTVFASALERDILQKMQEQGLPCEQQFTLVLDTFVRYLDTIEGWVSSPFAAFIQSCALENRLFDRFSTAVKAHPSNDMITLLVKAAEQMHPDDPFLPQLQSCIHDQLVHFKPGDKARQRIVEYEQTLPEQRPGTEWAPFRFSALQCYTPMVRKAERYSTCNARSNWNPRPDAPIQDVSARLLQLNQLTCLISDPFGLGTAYARDFSKHINGTVVLVRIEQFIYNRYAFELSVTRGKDVLCSYLYTSQKRRSQFCCKRMNQAEYVPEKPARQRIPLTQYLDKLPDELVLDEGEKRLRKRDLIPILEEVESGNNDWHSILERLEQLLYGRCRPLEWPRFEMATPSTCPEGYEPVDVYDVPQFGTRMEIYCRTADKDRLPKYRR